MKKRYGKLIISLVTALLLLLSFAGCGGSDAGSTAANSSSGGSAAKAPEIDGLTYESTEKMEYADQFSIFDYKDGYKVIDIQGDATYLLVPEGKDAPEGVSEDITVLQAPVERIYNAATASVALFSSMNGLGNIRMVSLDKDGWTFDSIKEEMDNGNIIFGGKYSEPDYETLIDEDCQLAIESTMIYHSPEVKEMIESLDIPVLVDHSSYESNPMGRTEWVKLYGALTGHEKEANEFFNKQLESLKSIKSKDSGVTVAYFYISTDGKAVVRSSTDYIPAMIKMAGGQYIFKDIVDDEGSSSIDMSIEQFFKTAKDADIVIYNGSIDSSVKSIDQLKAKNEVMAKFKAVKSGDCYYTGSEVYQRTDLSADMITDISNVINGKEPQNGFITKMK